MFIKSATTPPHAPETMTMPPRVATTEHACGVQITTARLYAGSPQQLNTAKRCFASMSRGVLLNHERRKQPAVPRPSSISEIEAAVEHPEFTRDPRASGALSQITTPSHII